MLFQKKRNDSNLSRSLPEFSTVYSPHRFPSPLTPYLLALRPHQWTKNLIVFAAPLFSLTLDGATWVNSFLAFALFCGASSGFYLINDLVDIEADRRHPVKCHRPIASGVVSKLAATGLAIVLLGGALSLSWFVAIGLGCAIAGYALLQVAYNIRLKHTVLLDVLAISAGFVLRAYGGSAATQIPLSSWLILCAAMLALFLGIEKRKAELRKAELGGTTRKVLKRYSQALLGRMENMVTTATIITYALWSSGPTVKGASTPWMMLTLPFVIYGVFRYQLLSDPDEVARRRDVNYHLRDKTERPEEVLLTDRPILLTVIAWAVACFGILLLKQHGIF